MPSSGISFEQEEMKENFKKQNLQERFKKNLISSLGPNNFLRINCSDFK